MAQQLDAHAPALLLLDENRVRVLSVAEHDRHAPLNVGREEQADLAEVHRVVRIRVDHGLGARVERLAAAENHRAPLARLVDRNECRERPARGGQRVAQE